MCSADADSKEVNGSVPGLYTVNITADTPQLDQTACACGSKKVFCQALSCLNLFCKPCARKAFRRHVPEPFDFQSCSMAEVPSHKCHALAKGHFCNICVIKHLVTCAECEQLTCSLTQCQNCFLDFCSGCMGDDELTCNSKKNGLRHMQIWKVAALVLSLTLRMSMMRMNMMKMSKTCIMSMSKMRTSMVTSEILPSSSAPAGLCIVLHS